MSAARSPVLEATRERVFSRHPINVTLDLIALRSGVPKIYLGAAPTLAKRGWARSWPENWLRPTGGGGAAASECWRAGSGASAGALSVSSPLRA